MQLTLSVSLPEETKCMSYLPYTHFHKSSMAYSFQHQLEMYMGACVYILFILINLRYHRWLILWNAFNCNIFILFFKKLSDITNNYFCWTHIFTISFFFFKNLVTTLYFKLLRHEELARSCAFILGLMWPWLLWRSWIFELL